MGNRGNPNRNEPLTASAGAEANNYNRVPLKGSVSGIFQGTFT